MTATVMRGLRAVDRLFWDEMHVADANLAGMSPATRDADGTALWFGEAKNDDVVQYFMANVLIGAGGAEGAQERWQARHQDALAMIARLPETTRIGQVKLWNVWLNNFNMQAKRHFGDSAPEFALFNESGTGLESVAPVTTPPPLASLDVIAQILAQMTRLLHAASNASDMILDMLDITSLPPDAREQLQKIYDVSINEPKAPMTGDAVKDIQDYISAVAEHNSVIEQTLAEFADTFSEFSDQAGEILEVLNA